MFQERSLYCDGNKKIVDLNKATELDPTLIYPYQYRAAALMDEQKVQAAVNEINRILGFKVTPDCLELRAYFCLALQEYEGAIRDVRALLTLNPKYMMFGGRVGAWQLLRLLSQHVEQWTKADCWMQLYDRWSSVDDIGSLAVVHQMLESDPGKGLLFFRQSLLLLR
jgi:tetratricopeptide (TPR) repeat protein